MTMVAITARHAGAAAALRGICRRDGPRGSIRWQRCEKTDAPLRAQHCPAFGAAAGAATLVGVYRLDQEPFRRASR